MPTIRMDGTFHTGVYRIECGDCGDAWNGQGEPIGAVNWSPALAIAEAVVHAKLGHRQEQIEVYFSERFRLWLIHYWERASLRASEAAAEARRSEAVRWGRSHDVASQ